MPPLEFIGGNQGLYRPDLPDRLPFLPVEANSESLKCGVSHDELVAGGTTRRARTAG
jgi:hypothetical protein